MVPPLTASGLPVAAATALLRSATIWEADTRSPGTAAQHNYEVQWSMRQFSSSSRGVGRAARAAQTGNGGWAARQTRAPHRWSAG